ncbi:hypothetical protein AN958_12886 [Leucoagaricus sp. SymC.cos]|nr:hypothetical protein AN958_12886 [Leucoagaricus sp. SymC.cos]
MQTSQEEESSYILATLERMDNEIRDVRSRAAGLNNIYSATFSLPSEVLATIFLDVCSDKASFKEIGVRNPVIEVVSRVCSQWRRVACTTPSLWARVHLQFMDSEWATVTSFRVLQLHFLNAGGLPVHVTLDISRCSGCHRLLHFSSYMFSSKVVPTKYTSYTTIFSFILVENSEKLGTLTLTPHSSLPSNWTDALSSYTMNSTKGFPNLTKFNIHTNTPDWNTQLQSRLRSTCELFKGTEVPRLQKVFAANLLIPIQLPFASLATLCLDHFPINDCISLLKECPRLTDFRSSYPSGPPDTKHDLAPVTKPIVLHNLRTLVWGFGYKSWDATLMTHFEFPSLSSLYVEHVLAKRARWYRDDLQSMSQPEFATKYWIPFLHSLPRLRCFSHDMIQSFAGTDDHGLRSLWETLSHIDTLEDLKVHGWQCSHQQLIDNILLPLTLKNGTGFLPHLKSLSFGGECVPRQGDDIDKLLGMLESRVNVSQEKRPLQSLHLHDNRWDSSPIPHWERWPGMQKERLLELTVDGLNIRASQHPIHRNDSDE